MKYVYAVLVITYDKPLMQIYLSESRLTKRLIFDKIVLTENERKKYHDYITENEILKDLNTFYPIQVEIQEVEVE